MRAHERGGRRGGALRAGHEPLLAARSVDHVVLERGEVAHSWRTQRWDSLRLLTPNWMTRLPGYAYRGDDPDGYLGAPEVVAAARGLRRGVGGTGGDRHDRDVDQGRGGGLRGAHRPGQLAHAHRGGRHGRDRGRRRAAPGWPRGARRVVTVTAADYRNPDRLPPGGVLVVGASASGVQIAEELQRSGRPVTLAVGEHVRVPRTYRGRDILWWMDASGLLDER